MNTRKQLQFKCKQCKCKLVPFDTPTHCNGCILKLNKELTNLQEQAISEYQSADLSDLGTISGDITQRFKAILRKYNVRTDIELADILSS